MMIYIEWCQVKYSLKDADPVRLRSYWFDTSKKSYFSTTQRWRINLTLQQFLPKSCLLLWIFPLHFFSVAHSCYKWYSPVTDFWVYMYGAALESIRPLHNIRLGQVLQLVMSLFWEEEQLHFYERFPQAWNEIIMTMCLIRELRSFPACKGPQSTTTFWKLFLLSSDCTCHFIPVCEWLLFSQIEWKLQIRNWYLLERWLRTLW